MKKETLHIGKKIQEVVNEKGMSDAEFGRRISTSRQNVSYIYTRSSIDTQKLLDISKALDHDFFMYYQSDKTQTKFDKIESKAKVVIELELNADEIFKFGLKDKVLEMFKK
jgi:transcriptional regulator with XRE-family HTH domain